MRLDPVSLQMFVTVAETQNIAAAAEREHIAASALSRRLSELESRLGAVLLNRTNKGVALTAAGHALLGLARTVLSDLDDVAIRMQDYAGGLRGFVRVAATPSAIVQFFPAQLATFAQKYPEVHIQIQEGHSANIPRYVSENSVDVGIFVVGLYEKIQTTPLKVIPYHHDELVIITPSRHPLSKKRKVTFEETLDFEYTLMDDGSFIHSLVTRSSSINRTLKVRVHVTSYHAMCIMVESGFGIAALPRGCAEFYRSAHDFQILDLAEPWAQRQIAICVRDSEALAAAAKSLVTHLRGGE